MGIFSSRDEMKKGDWNCPNCNYLCYASKYKCPKCLTNKIVNKKPGDWTCSCGEINFASRTKCRKCNKDAVKEIKEKKEIVFKPGDWFCQSCNDLNFKIRINCRKCGTIRQDYNTNIQEEYTEKDNCVVCMDKIANMCIKKCGHLGLCEACSYQLKKCPLCRIDFSLDDLLKVYKA
jgi:hypothetical protein